MKKLLIIFALLFLPTMSLAGNSMSDAVSQMSDTIQKSSGISIGGGGSGLEQAWNDFKNDPIGEIKRYWNELVIMMVDGYNALKDKVNEMLN
jgi:hypothetical protein